MPASSVFDLQPPAAPRRSPDEPMRILILGDFSGRGRRPAAGDAFGRVPVAVDGDTLDTVLAGFAPRLELALDQGGGQIAVEFRALEDFHPDALYRRLALFEPWRQLRRRLADPATFAAAALEIGRPAADGREMPIEDNAATLERLLGKPAVVARSPEQAAVDRWIKTLVEPHSVAAADPEPFIAAVDTALGERMRLILHHPAVQALEAAWRGVQGLVSGLDADGALQWALLDVSREELAADLAAGNDPRRSKLYGLLVDRGARAPGGEPWSLLVGNYDFGASPQDITLLGALGVIAAQAGGPFLAAADASLLGCRSLRQTPDPADWSADDPEFERHWQALRRSAVAPWLGLALPRVLLRLPYGPNTDSIDEFAFEELPAGPEPGALLWGNPAFVCARLLGAAWLDRALPPGAYLEIDDLPAYVYREQGESRLLPCAEALLGERAMQRMLARGLMPLLSARNRNAVRLARLQSLADPPRALAGA